MRERERVLEMKRDRGSKREGVSERERTKKRRRTGGKNPIQSGQFESSIRLQKFAQSDFPLFTFFVP